MVVNVDVDVNVRQLEQICSPQCLLCHLQVPCASLHNRLPMETASYQSFGHLATVRFPRPTYRALILISALTFTALSATTDHKDR